MLRTSFLSLALISPAFGAPDSLDRVFSTAVGTQTIGVRYQFTEEGALLETAREIHRMGSDTLKIAVSPNYVDNYRMEKDPSITSMLELVRTKTDFAEAFNLPFRNIMLWIYPFSDTLSGFMKGEIPKEEADAIYKEIFDFTAHLLQTYSGSGKSFFLGNWEGDWHLMRHIYKYDMDPEPESIKGAIQWFNLRQKAIADAIEKVEHHGVRVYFYVAIHHVRKSLLEGRPSIVNKVLPHIKTDFVSWSSYDVTTKSAMRGDEEGRKFVMDALDYIESNLPPSDIPGKRVFIGEYGFNAEQVKDPEEQAEFSRRVIQWALEWGCPFILYWELYCNEINKETGAHRGFWLIDQSGRKLPAWDLHKGFLEQANRYVDDYVAKNGRRPSQEEYNRAAAAWLKPSQD